MRTQVNFNSSSIHSQDKPCEVKKITEVEHLKPNLSTRIYTYRQQDTKHNVENPSLVAVGVSCDAIVNPSRYLFIENKQDLFWA